jgi:hypothetical protein
LASMKFFNKGPLPTFRRQCLRLATVCTVGLTCATDICSTVGFNAVFLGGGPEGQQRETGVTGEENAEADKGELKKKMNKHTQAAGKIGARRERSHDYTGGTGPGTKRGRFPPRSSTRTVEKYKLKTPYLNDPR